MSMISDNFVGLRCHVVFYASFISHCHWYWVSKGSVYLGIPGIGRVIAIWDEVFFKLLVCFDGLVTRKEVFLESSHRIEAHLDVIVEVIEIRSSVSFEFCLRGELIYFWWAYLMISVIFCAMKALILSLFDNAFMYWKRSLVGETIYPDIMISCWSLRILTWKSSSCSPLLKAMVDRSDWTSPFILPRRGARECRSLESIFHPEI